MLQDFIKLIEHKSKENSKSFNLLYSQKLYGSAIAQLRIELDLLIRVCYLIQVDDINQVNKLMKDTIDNEEWKKLNGDIIKERKMLNITKQMIDYAGQFNNWVEEVYKFGCNFIHLSNYSNYEKDDPLKKLESEKKKTIKKYLQTYHLSRPFPDAMEVSFVNVLPYLPEVLNKVSTNLHLYLEKFQKKVS